MEIKSVHQLSKEEGWNVYKAKFIPWLIELKQGVDAGALDMASPVITVINKIKDKITAISELKDPEEYKQNINQKVTELMDAISKDPNDVGVVKQAFFAYLSMLRFYTTDATMISLDAVTNIAHTVPELSVLDSYTNISPFEKPEKLVSQQTESLKVTETKKEESTEKSDTSVEKKN